MGRGHRRLTGQGQRKLLTGRCPVSLAPHNPQVTEILIYPKALQLTESCSTEASDILLKMKGDSFPPLYLTFLFFSGGFGSMCPVHKPSWIVFLFRIYLASWPSSLAMAISATASSRSTLRTQTQDYGDSTWFVNKPRLLTCCPLYKKNGEKKL